MEQFQIETAQNVRVSQNVATIKDRILATLIDGFVIIAYFVLFFFLGIHFNFNFDNHWDILIVISLPVFVYNLLLETFANGKTIGKAALSIRVVKLDGTKPSFSSYFIRWIVRLFEVGFSSGGLAVLVLLIKGNGQRLGDIAAGTTVISEKKNATIKDVLFVDLPEDYTPTFPQVTVFKDHEIQTIKTVYDTAVINKDHKIINRLDNRIKEVTGISTEILPLQFVDIIIKDYNHYTQQ